MRISDWSSDVCSSDLCWCGGIDALILTPFVLCLSKHRSSLSTSQRRTALRQAQGERGFGVYLPSYTTNRSTNASRSEEHTSELQSLMRISYAVFCLKKTKTTKSTYI